MAQPGPEIMKGSKKSCVYTVSISVGVVKCMQGRRRFRKRRKNLDLLPQKSSLHREVWNSPPFFRFPVWF